MEGGPISSIDVEKELGICHPTFLYSLAKIGGISFTHGKSLRGRGKKLYYLTWHYRSIKLNTNHVLGCEIICMGVKIESRTCTSCSQQTKIFKKCRFKSASLEQMNRMGFDDKNCGVSKVVG